MSKLIFEISTLVFPSVDKSKKKRKSQHAKDHVELKLEVSQNPTNLEEDGTEILHQAEATSIKPVPEGTEIPLRGTDSTRYNQDNANRIHERLSKSMLQIFDFSC